MPALQWKNFNAFGFPQGAVFSGYEHIPLAFRYTSENPRFQGEALFEVCEGSRLGVEFDYSKPDEHIQEQLWSAVCWALWSFEVSGRHLPKDWVRELGPGTTAVPMDYDLTHYAALEAQRAEEREKSMTPELRVMAEFHTEDSIRTMNRLRGELYEHLTTGELQDVIWDLLQTGGLVSKIRVRSRVDPDFALAEFDHSSEIPETIEEDGNYDDEPFEFKVMPHDLELNLMRGPDWRAHE